MKTDQNRFFYYLAFVQGEILTEWLTTRGPISPFPNDSPKSKVDASSCRGSKATLHLFHSDINLKMIREVYRLVREIKEGKKKNNRVG